LCNGRDTDASMYLFSVFLGAKVSECGGLLSRAMLVHPHFLRTHRYAAHERAEVVNTPADMLSHGTQVAPLGGLTYQLYRVSEVYLGSSIDRSDRTSAKTRSQTHPKSEL